MTRLAMNLLPPLALLAMGVAAQGPAPQPSSPGDLGFTLLANGLAVRAVPIEGSGHSAFVFGLRSGWLHDPAGERGLGNALASAFRVALDGSKGGHRLEVRYSSHTTLVGVVCEKDKAAAALERFCSWLEGKAPFDDDAAEIGIHRARLDADSAAEMLPGPMLEARLRAQLAIEPRLPLGEPKEMGFTVARVRRCFAERCVPSRAFLVVVGACVESEIRERLAKVPTRAVPVDPAAASGSRPSTGATAPPAGDLVHPRIDAPFASVAWRVPEPSSPSFVPSLVVAEIVRARAMVAFTRYRGGEVEARFPFLSYDPQFGSPLLIVNRRGFNGDEADRTRGELRAFLQRLRTEPPDHFEIGQAAVNLARTFWLPPYSGGEEALRASPALLFSRAVTLAAAWSHSWPADFSSLVQKVDIPTVQRMVVEMLAPERLAWATLVPDPARAVPEKR